MLFVGKDSVILFVVVGRNVMDRGYSAVDVGMRRRRYCRWSAGAEAGSTSSGRGRVRRMIGSQRGRAIEAHRSPRSHPFS